MTIQSLDTQLLLLINHGTANVLFDILMPALSSQGYLLVLPFLLFLIVNSANQKNAQGKGDLIAVLWSIAIACCAVFLAERTVDELKIIIERERPCRAIEGIRLVTSCPKSFSMPSSHAATSFAFIVPILFLIRTRLKNPWRFFLLVLASLIAFSRMYMGVHYPTDVLAGALLGAGTGMALSVVWLVISSRFSRKGETTPEF